MAAMGSCRAGSSSTGTNARGPQRSTKASYYRGGTSRAVMFSQGDLPPDRAAWAPIFRASIGSPDPEHGRQLDGMGGGISSLSKACVAGPATVEGADVDFTFAALGVRDDLVDYSSNCGNMSAAVGPFAVDSGLVPVPPQTVLRLALRDAGVVPSSRGGEEDGGAIGAAAVAVAAVAGTAPDDVNFTVRIHNTNTGKIMAATFPLASSPDAPGGVEAAASGSCAIDGVAGTGAPVRLDFLRPAGSRTGKLLPTGRAVDEIEVPADGDGPAAAVRATLIDAGNPCCFVAAADLGVADGTMSAAAIDADEPLKRRLEAVRRRAAVMMGLADRAEDAPGSVPKIGFVSRQAAAAAVAAASSDAVTVRAMSVGQPHKAVPLTVAIALAAAARLPGSVVADCVVRPEVAGRDGGGGDDAGLVVHHASGTLTVGAKFSDEGHLEHATVYRTARRLMEGKIFWK
ncbi:hypothetical protein RB595_008524 [Gaeumannomyces hyphopodioides]